MVATARQQSVAANGVYRAVGRAVVEMRRRRDRLQAQIDGNRVPLLGADTAVVGAEREALLVVFRHHLPQPLQRQRHAGLLRPSQQRVYIRPALRVERQANAGRVVAQDAAQELAEADDGIAPSVSPRPLPAPAP